MIIYPAIDLKGGRCVRLYKGDMNQDTVYNESPAQQAHEWARAGFSWIHVVDLDGAVQGAPVNEQAVRAIVDAVDIPVQLGGGIRTLAQIGDWLEQGVSRVILGTVAVRNPALVAEACTLFPGQIVIGLDARAGNVAVEGWVEDSTIKATDLAKKFEDIGVCGIIYTDIDRDGTGEGLNMDSTLALARATALPVIASGGVGSLEDLKNVYEAGKQGISGVIVGKALYEKKFTAREALAVAAGGEGLSAAS
ncbi:MAG: 1-(5-phosphoribosyl)-5-[(5-phosphoribosylamino)methylideneamino]imidazole-4-carboxamide isomerase [Alphaproteobacteria bacterium]|nr:1-(5-phosphoribosyl)-5-[(5-phosphoribosylamino)methylideneamino]imidazole-4-carboxamide isomerase [Alphaproteobacteria bacterium]